MASLCLEGVGAFDVLIVPWVVLFVPVAARRFRQGNRRRVGSICGTDTWNTLHNKTIAREYLGRGR